MNVQFQGLTIAGIVQPWARGQWNQQTQLTTLFGLEGSVSLYGGRTNCPLSIPVWLFNSYSSKSALTNFIKSIEAKIGRIGSVVENSGYTETYEHCQLMAVVTLEPPLPPNSHIGWSQLIGLEFLQLRP